MHRWMSFSGVCTWILPKINQTLVEAKHCGTLNPKLYWRLHRKPTEDSLSCFRLVLQFLTCCPSVSKKQIYQFKKLKTSYVTASQRSVPQSKKGGQAYGVFCPPEQQKREEWAGHSRLNLTNFTLIVSYTCDPFATGLCLKQECRSAP